MVRVEESSKVVEKEKTRLDFDIHRTPSNVVIYLKSEPIHEFFKSLSIEGEVETTKKWGGVEKFFKLTAAHMPKMEDVTFDEVGGDLLTGTGQNVVNMSFLRAVDLDKGVEFKLGGLIYTPTVTSFENGFVDAVGRFVEDRIAEYHHTFQITTRRVFEDGEVIKFRSA